MRITSWTLMTAVSAILTFGMLGTIDTAWSDTNRREKVEKETKSIMRNVCSETLVATYATGEVKCDYEDYANKGVCCKTEDGGICIDGSIFDAIIKAYQEKQRYNNTLFQGAPNLPPSSPDSTEITERLDRIIELLEKMRYSTYRGR